MERHKDKLKGGGWIDPEREFGRAAPRQSRARRVTSPAPRVV